MDPASYADISAHTVNCTSVYIYMYSSINMALKPAPKGHLERRAYDDTCKYLSTR
jgi:hypothetical protein